MSIIEWSVMAIALVNVALALAVGTIYLRNHRAVHSPFTWVLLLFASFLVLHNAFQVYEFFAMMGSFDGIPTTLLAVEGLLQSATTIALLAAAVR